MDVSRESNWLDPLFTRTLILMRVSKHGNSEEGTNKGKGDPVFYPRQQVSLRMPQPANAEPGPAMGNAGVWGLPIGLGNRPVLGLAGPKPLAPCVSECPLYGRDEEDTSRQDHS